MFFLYWILFLNIKKINSQKQKKMGSSNSTNSSSSSATNTNTTPASAAAVLPPPPSMLTWSRDVWPVLTIFPATSWGYMQVGETCPDKVLFGPNILVPISTPAALTANQYGQNGGAGTSESDRPVENPTNAIGLTLNRTYRISCRLLIRGLNISSARENWAFVCRASDGSSIPNGVFSQYSTYVYDSYEESAISFETIFKPTSQDDTLLLIGISIDAQPMASCCMASGSYVIVQDLGYDS